MTGRGRDAARLRADARRLRGRHAHERAAQERGVLVLYPAQAPRSNQHRCWNWFVPADQQRGAGEPALLAAMTRHAMALHPVDPRRVYVAGLSAGGAMADILATEYADLYAAAGVHSGVRRGVAHDAVSAYEAMQGREPGAALHAALGRLPRRALRAIRRREGRLRCRGRDTDHRLSR